MLSLLMCCQVPCLTRAAGTLLAFTGWSSDTPDAYMRTHTNHAQADFLTAIVQGKAKCPLISAEHAVGVVSSPCPPPSPPVLYVALHRGGTE